MKKLSKLSLLGEMDLLSKKELQDLIGAKTDGCSSWNEISSKYEGQCWSSAYGGYIGTCSWSRTENKCWCAGVAPKVVYGYV